MTEPLIVVEGNLRLPTLRPLANLSFNFGDEWAPARTRPLQSASEFALFAARFHTAYVAAISLSDAASPYRAASLWGIFGKEEIPRAMLRLMEAGKLSGDTARDRADPIPLNVGAPVAASARHFSKPVTTAIALAGGAFILWLLFGYKPGASDDDADTRIGSAASSATAVTAATPLPSSDTNPQREVFAAPPVPVPDPSTPAAAQTVAIAEQPATPALAEPVVAKTEHDNVALAPAKPDTVSVVTTRRASGMRVAAEPAARKHEGRVKGPHVTRTKVALSRKSATSTRIAKHDVARHARANPVDNYAPRRAAPTAASLDPATLYAMLQHSPTLDSNSAGASRGGAQSPNAR